MRLVIWFLGPSASLQSLGSVLAAETRLAVSHVPRLGDVIPASLRVIGVDGESFPRPYGLLIIDGRIIVLVESRSRKVVEVISDSPLSAPAPPAR